MTTDIDTTTLATDKDCLKVEMLARSRGALHWPELVRVINRMRTAEAALAKAQQERDETKHAANGYAEQWSRASSELAKVREALAGLIGLVQLVRGRTDCPLEIKQALTDHYRLDDAYAALGFSANAETSTNAETSAYDADLGDKP